MTHRVGVVGLWHETNTFSSIPTQLTNFADFELLAGDELGERNKDTRTVIGGYLASDATGLEIVPVFSAGAWPSGPVEEEVLSELLHRTEDELKRARSLDAVLVNLHGAMVAERTSDVEVAVLDVIRRAVGDVPVGAVLDLHANPSADLVRAADVLVSYDTFPHVDMFERGLEVAGLLDQVLSGRQLSTSIRKMPLLVCPVAQSTEGGPLRDLQTRAFARAREAGIARVSIVGGFAYSDVERAGMSVMAIHEPQDADAANQVLEETVQDIARNAHQFDVVRDNTSAAVQKALRSGRRPTFLVDIADNIGGGSPGDGTALLSELLRVGARDAIVTISDPEVALVAAGLGEGADIAVWLGGKSDRLHGDPVFVRGHVARVTDGRYRSGGYYMTGQEFSMGTTAVLSVNGNTIVVTERPTPPFHAEQLSSVGVDVTQAQIVVVKGAIAWREAYRGVVGDIVEAATPGICPVDVSTLRRRTTPQAL